MRFNKETITSLKNHIIEITYNKFDIVNLVCSYCGPSKGMRDMNYQDTTNFERLRC